MHLATHELVTLPVVGKLPELLVSQFGDDFGTHGVIIHYS
jgi:hypothetical protein